MTAEWIEQWPLESSMRLHCEFSTSVARTDLDDYIRHLEISVGCYDENGLKEYVVGNLAVDQIMWMNALVDGVSLFEICDSDSQGDERQLFSRSTTITTST